MCKHHRVINLVCRRGNINQRLCYFNSIELLVDISIYGPAGEDGMGVWDYIAVLQTD